MRWSPTLPTGPVQDTTLTPHPSSGLRGTPDATFPSRGRQGFTELLQDILTDTGEVFVHVFVGISQYMQPAFTQIRIAFSIRLHPCLFKML